MQKNCQDFRLFKIKTKQKEIDGLIVECPVSTNTQAMLTQSIWSAGYPSLEISDFGGVDTITNGGGVQNDIMDPINP